MDDDYSFWQITVRVVLVVVAFALLIALGCYASPKYHVWEQGLKGEAKHRKAEQERQVLVERAKAEMQAAEFQAKAIGVVGEAAKKYPEYRYQEFLRAHSEALERCEIDLIYVPTEANIPLTEAGRALGR